MGLFQEILSAPDRARTPGARPLVSLHEDEDPAELGEIEDRILARHELRRRGWWHGIVAELEPGWQEAPSYEVLQERWRAARPILLAGQARDGVAALPDELQEAMRLEEELRTPGGLSRWLRSPERLPAGFSPSPRRPSFQDPERDLEKVFVHWTDPRSRLAVKDLWVKSGRLSNHPEDESLRVRVSAGREVDDDASDDLARHRLVAELAEDVLPGALAATREPHLLTLLEAFLEDPVLLTQPIAYWNAPEGGALFHHDAFQDGDDGQRGVCFVQLVGRTLWLALPLEELALRVREFVHHMGEGELDWVRQELCPQPRDFEALVDRVWDDERLLRELALPGCGALGPLVNRGPEFTGFLVDAGHGLVLDPGDVLVLPNHGFRSTVMHSVFCASHLTTYGLSFAVRADRPAPEVESDEGAGTGERRRSRSS